MIMIMDRIENTLSIWLGRERLFLWSVGISLLLALLIPSPAMADLSVTLELDRREATLDDSIRLVVKVDGARQSESRPVVHGLESFIVTQGGTSSHVKIINGRINAGIEYTFFLQPQKAGSFQVGPAEVRFKGNTFKSNMATLKIFKAGQAINEADQRPLFLSATLSSKEVYVEEQTFYILKLYLRVRVSNISLDLPEVEGISFKQLGKPYEYSSVLHGRTYNVLEARYALFPTREGIFTIPSSKMHLTIYESGGRSRRGIFDDPFFSRGRPMTLAGEPLKLRVLPLPQKGRPADFSGLVGTFSIDSSLEPSEIKSGESATLTVSLTGRGNISRMPDLKMQKLSHTKVYADKPVLKVRSSDKGQEGSKTMKWALVPAEEGTYDIPPFSVSFFDTSLHKYHTIMTTLHKLKVLPSEKGEAIVQRDQDKPKTVKGQLKKDIEELGHDILPAHTSIKDLSTGFQVRPGGPFFWLIIAIPFFAYAVTFWGLRSREKSAASLAVSRARRAAKELSRRCRKRGLLFCELSEAVRDYVNDRLGLSIGSLTPKEAGTILSERGVSQAAVQKFKGLVQRIEDAVYTGKGDEPCLLEKETLQLIRQLEEEIR